ncbi:hypothetical protein Tco_0761947 [Tanacetum coccineum]
MSLNDYRGLDVPTAKLFLIPTGKLMVPAGSSWFLLVGFVVPAGLLTVSSASIIDSTLVSRASYALDLGLIRWQQSDRSEGNKVSSQTLTSKHMDWFTAGLDVPTAKLFLIPTGKLMVHAVRFPWFLLVVPLSVTGETGLGTTHSVSGMVDEGEGGLLDTGCLFGPQPQSPSPIESDASSTVSSTCQSNDSDGEQGTVSDHSVNDDPIPIPSSEQVTTSTQKTQPQVPKPQQTVDPSCAQHVKTPRQPIRTPVTPSPILHNNRRELVIKNGKGIRVNVNTGHGNVSSVSSAGTQIKSGASRFNIGKQHVNSGTQIKSGGSRFNTGKQNFNSGRVHVNTARVHRPVLSNQTSNKTKFSHGDLKEAVNTASNTFTGSKEVIDIDEQTEEAADLMVVSSTSLKEATRKAAVSAKSATKKTPSLKQPSFYTNINFEEVNTGNTEAISPSADHEEEVFSDADDDEMPEIRIYDKSSEGIFEKASYDDEGIISDFNNLPDEVDVPTNPTLRIHNAHPQSQILGDPNNTRSD